MIKPACCRKHTSCCSMVCPLLAPVLRRADPNGGQPELPATSSRAAVPLQGHLCPQQSADRRVLQALGCIGPSPERADVQSDMIPSHNSHRHPIIDAEMRVDGCHRVLFAPNLHDASPRVLAEALCLDVPILVNRHIVGGWKYVHSETGAFFDSIDNVVPAFRDIINGLQRGDLHPREWFRCVLKLSCLSPEKMHVYRPLACQLYSWNLPGFGIIFANGSTRSARCITVLVWTFYEFAHGPVRMSGVRWCRNACKGQRHDRGSTAVQVPQR